MAKNRLLRSVVVLLSIAFVTSAFVVLIAPPASAALWTQTTDTDFNQARTINGLDIIGTGDPAYLQLKKDFYNWFNKNPLTAPDKRYGHTMVFDSVNGRMLMFGGLDDLGNYRNDLWAYYLGNNTWQQISANAPPSARYYAGMSFDSRYAVAVLYGGYDMDGADTETWEYDAITGAWTNTTPPGSPTQLTSNPMTFDSTANVTILAAQGRTAWETWAYDASTDTWSMRTGSNPPADRAGHKLAYYPEIDKTVLYGGASGLTILDQTWEYDYTTDAWVDKTGNTGGFSPGGRTSYGFAYRTDQADLFLWGGQGSTGYPVNTWRYQGSGNTRVWIEIMPGSSPTPRRDHGLAHDGGLNSAVVFGGTTPAGGRLNDTWAYEPGFRAQGFIESSIFDSLYANTQWVKLFWNQTSYPPGSSIRFQLSANNIANPNDPSWVWKGPDGATNTYYTLSGTTIWSGWNNMRYMKYKADLLCASCIDSPHLEDVSIEYNAPSIAPYVVSKGPETPPYFSVPITSNIWINFSEPMDTSQVTVSLNPPDVTLTYNWNNSDTELILTHTTPFNYCTQYFPRIETAVDKQGQSMTGLPSQWPFVTICPDPEITETYPHHSDVDIPLTSPIYVNFSKQMNTSSVNVNITPALITDTFQWSNGNKNLVVPHTTEDFIDCQIYTVEVTGKDVNNKALIPGSVPNPWTFETHCLNPLVISTDPFADEIEVEIDRAVVITFNHEMDTPTVAVTFTPSITLPGSWNSPTNTTLTLNHPPNFATCTKYTVNVTGKDKVGNDLQGGYYLWSFFTTCGGSPFIVTTQPADGAADVPLDLNITLAFSEAMVPGSIVYMVFPPWVHTINWTGMNMVMILEHGDRFTACTKYYVNVTDGIDVNEGKHLVPGPVPNLFTFNTECPNPFVTSIVPPDGSIDVANDTNIVIRFSKQMNTTSFAYTITPGISLLESWSDGDTVFHLDHGPLFQDCTFYTLRIAFAEDIGGNFIVGDTEFNFTTFCPGVNPWIVTTDPYDGEPDVPLTRVINVTFSEPMDPASLVVLILPSIALARQWAPDFTWVELTHPAFIEGTTYNVTVTACDMDGDCLVQGPVPNPWEFTTISINPVIMSTAPFDDEQNVGTTRPIVVQFSKSMDPLTVNWAITPGGITYVDTWTNLNRTLTLTHPTTPFAICTEYNVTITGSDTGGNPLVAGPVPNPWRFSTTCSPGAPGNLQVHRQTNDILLTWRAAMYADGYHVYEAKSKLSPWPWPLLANVTTTSHLALGHNNDGETHFYVVRAYNSTSWLEGGNSTMGVKHHRTFTLNPTGPNSQWFSLPYVSIYKKASDITNELGPGSINVVAKWDGAKQKSILYYYLNGRWRGTDFTINRGDGLWLGVVSTFSWSINGTDVLQALVFTMNPPPRTSYFWVSLPYTTSYADASAIANELTNTKIEEIGRYNPLTNGIDRWYWTGSMWTGNNFPILPGDGIYLKIVATFSWTPKLLTPVVP